MTSQWTLDESEPLHDVEVEPGVQREPSQDHTRSLLADWHESRNRDSRNVDLPPCEPQRRASLGKAQFLATAAAASALALTALFGAALSPLAARWTAREPRIDPVIERATVAALGRAGSDSAERLVDARVGIMRDVTVVFVLRDEGSANANRSAARSDALAIFRAVYQSPEIDPVVTVTLQGVHSPSGTNAARPAPVLYAFLPFDKVAGIAWGEATPDDLEAIATLRWLPDGMCQAWQLCGGADGG
jgi:hypothetical protein